MGSCTSARYNTVVANLRKRSRTEGLAREDDDFEFVSAQWTVSITQSTKYSDVHWVRIMKRGRELKQRTNHRPTKINF